MRQKKPSLILYLRCVKKCYVPHKLLSEEIVTDSNPPNLIEQSDRCVCICMYILCVSSLYSNFISLISELYIPMRALILHSFITQ